MSSTTSTSTTTTTSTRGRGGYRGGRGGKKNKKEFKPTSVDVKSLSGTVLKRWHENRVFFDQKKAEEYVDKAPASDSPADIIAWAKNHPFLKISSYKVPIGILPEKLGETHLHDITVKPPRSRGPRIIDDDIYDAFPHVRTYVPRGLCIVEAFNSETKQKTLQVSVLGMVKFTGGPGDDDDFDEADADEANSKTPRYEHYFLEPAANTVSIISTTKENGDAAHLGQVRLDGVTYLVLGSKNVHLLAKKVSDIDKYTENRFMVARLVAKSMLEYINSLDQKAFDKFLDYMNDHQLTATLEFLQIDNQHIEFFDFDKSRFRFIAFTTNKNRDSLVYDDILASVSVAKEAGFDTVQVEKFTYAQQNEVFDKVRAGYGTEGAVLYYVNANGHVIGMVKKKTIWYILVRAVREKIKPFSKRVADPDNDSKDSLNRITKKLKDTMKQKQTWLGFSDEVYEQWTQLSIGCAKWMVDAVKKPDFDMNEVDRMFPKVWNQYLSETKQTDHVKV
jgi:hypothetical protein